MEKVCCEYKHEDTEVQVFETEDGYRIVIKGDKDKIRAVKESCCGPSGLKISCC